MSDFLDAVARRAIGEPVGLRPAAPPWIPPADERGRAAQIGRPAPQSEPSPPDAARPDDSGAERRTPIEAPMASPAERSLRRSWRKGPTAEGAENRPPETIESALTNDRPPNEARRSDRPERSESSPAEPPTPERGRPPREPLAAAEALPVAPEAVAANRTMEPIQPDGTIRPLAAVDRPMDDGRWGERTSIGADDDDAPVVHVSIGRIEVSAPPPPPTRPAPAPIALGLSLEAYLRRRDEAERR